MGIFQKIKNFFKPNKEKLITTTILFLITAILLFKAIAIGLVWNVTKIFGMTLGFPYVGYLLFGSIEVLVISAIIDFCYLYLFTCIIMPIIKPLLRFLKNNFLKIAPNNEKKKKLLIIFSAILVVIIISGSVFAYGVSKLGWGDIFLKNANEIGATKQGVQQISNSNKEFALNMYSTIRKNLNNNNNNNNNDNNNNNKNNDYNYNEENKNIFFSPYSISTAVSMTYEGAGGETAKEMEKVFGFNNNDYERRSSVAKIINELNHAHSNYKISVANSVWLQKDYPFLDSYKQIIKDYYLGEVKNIDFSNSLKASSKINNWVSDKTNNKIEKIVSPRIINSQTRAILVNAIYFKGKWLKPFDKKYTREDKFNLSDNKEVSTSFMTQTDYFEYSEFEDLKVLKMDYIGRNLSMIILLPKENNLSMIEEKLTDDNFKKWTSNFKYSDVHVKIPKFKFDTDYDLSSLLEQMGLTSAFTPGEADFSGMDGTKKLYFDKVLHKAYIDVYEEGTEAAAATMISMSNAAALPTKTKEFIANHPFIFLIQENNNNNTLFLGRVMNPNE